MSDLFNSDECRNCSVRGYLNKCRLIPCYYHSLWITKELESRISAMQELCDKAVKHKSLQMEAGLYDAIEKYQESMK